MWLIGLILAESQGHGLAVWLADEYPYPSGTSAICLGDLLLTRYHLDHVCVPAVDDFPLESIAVKRVEFARAAEVGIWLIVAHDCDVVAQRCRPDRTVASELRLPPATVAHRNRSGGLAHFRVLRDAPTVGRTCGG